MNGPVDPLIGQTLDGRYVVRSKIARGGMATVYLGNDLRLGRSVAIKMMHPHLADDESFTRRFEQEARSAAGLGHPNVVNVFDQGESGGVPYLVMEYLPGITLRELLKQRSRLTPEEAGEIAEAVLAGLAAAHDAGIVHRDLKPENVLLADDGRIKIGDFGLARAVSANTTTGQALLGTIAYLSPELVTRGIADARSDLYAFGIVLYEMLTGEQPYTGEQPVQIAYQHAHSDVPLPSSVQASVTEGFDQLVLWTTQRDADSRPSNAREALLFLRALQSGDNTAATSVLPATASLHEVTPSTTILSSTDQSAIAAGGVQQTMHEARGQQPAPSNSASATGASAVSRAKQHGRQKGVRGRLLAALVTLLIAVGAGAGWWWGQGPGSTVTVPDVTGSEIQHAAGALKELDLELEQFDCHSLTTPVGLIDHSDPEAGTRVDRGSVIRLCTSIGPEMLPVPPLIGLSLESAIDQIEAARFTFGEVLEERFDGNERDAVVLAMDPEGAGLGETYPELGRIDLIVSAGSVPEVAGLTVEAATTALSDVGLSVDDALNGQVHHESIAEGQVIRLLTDGEVLNTGEAVGLEVSLGPELFEVPGVTDMPLSEAVDVLNSAGFQVSHNVPELLYSIAWVTAMDPAAGEMRPAETVIHLSTTINLP